jgi:Zn-dependent M28 family amino/carboxypeptidase
MVDALSQSQYTTTLQTLENFQTRYTYTSTIDDAADWIYNTFQGFGLSVERHYFNINTYTKQNIIATKIGLLYPDEIVFITGHYDSTSGDPYNFAPGADDNGSGATAVIETARVLKNYNFERTIMFACFAGEEQGLVGSEAYVTDIYNGGMNVVGCYNLDMIAYSGTDPAPPNFMIYTNNDSLPIANRLHDAAVYYYPTDLEPFVYNYALGASDHASFWQYGYRAIMGIEDEVWGSDFNPYYHSVNDLVSNCDLEYATHCAQVSLAAVADHAGPQTEIVPNLTWIGWIMLISVFSTGLLRRSRKWL